MLLTIYPLRNVNFVLETSVALLELEFHCLCYQIVLTPLLTNLTSSCKHIYK